MHKPRTKAALRYYRIWQKTGTKPFFKEEICPCCGQPIRHCEEQRTSNGRDFFRGTFDSIPFLNDDAKRSFIHLLLRPGYMIMDYIRGRRDTYLAPMTALVVFYAFYALVLSVTQAGTFDDGSSFNEGMDADIEAFISNEDEDEDESEEGGTYVLEEDNVLLHDFLDNIKVIDTWVNLHRHPEEIDTPFKASVAAFEKVIVDQGVARFLGQFILLTLALWCVLWRRYRFSFSSSATAAAYILCQFCFFMTLAAIVTLGREHGLALWVMLIVLVYDFVQMFSINRRRAAWLTIKTGFMYAFFFAALIGIAALCVLAFTSYLE